MPDFPKASSNFVPDSSGGYSDNTASAAARAEGQLNGPGEPDARSGTAGSNVPGYPAGVAGADTAAIAVSGLAKRVADASGELTILHEVDFTVQRAETLAIVGASGSGKSTLLGLLAGLDTPSAGKVVLDGVDIYALDEDGRAALRKEKLGFVFQSFQLLAHLTAVENVMLPLELSGANHARERAEAMLERVGLASRLKHYPKYLSGGEQQRVALARAFVTEPPLLFADEPTGSLDATTGESVIKLMFELNRQHGSTLVLVTHDQSMAARCGRTITIAAGRLV